MVRASLLRFSRLWPVSAPLSFAFIRPSDCRVGKTASRSYTVGGKLPVRVSGGTRHRHRGEKGGRLTAAPDMADWASRRGFSCAVRMRLCHGPRTVVRIFSSLVPASELGLAARSGASWEPPTCCDVCAAEAGVWRRLGLLSAAVEWALVPVPAEIQASATQIRPLTRPDPSEISVIRPKGHFLGLFVTHSYWHTPNSCLICVDTRPREPFRDQDGQSACFQILRVALTLEFPGFICHGRRSHATCRDESTRPVVARNKNFAVVQPRPGRAAAAHQPWRRGSAMTLSTLRRPRSDQTCSAAQVSAIGGGPAVPRDTCPSVCVAQSHRPAHVPCRYHPTCTRFGNTSQRRA